MQVETAGYPHPSLTSKSLVGQILGPFLFASNMFGFVLLVSFLPTLADAYWGVASGLICWRGNFTLPGGSGAHKCSNLSARWAMGADFGGGG